jgi:hypothetical protein
MFHLYSEELRRWFITHELDLFRARFTQEPKESIYEFLKLNNLDYQPVSLLCVPVCCAILMKFSSFNKKKINLINFLYMNFHFEKGKVAYTVCLK